MRQSREKSSGVPPASRERDATRQKSIAKLKETLIRRRQELRAFLNGESAPIWGDEAISGDAADMALGISRDELSFQRIDSISNELNQVEIALERIEDHTYGLCEACGGMIPIARLRFLPYAGKCVICQEAEDEYRRNFPGGEWHFSGTHEIENVF